MTSTADGQPAPVSIVTGASGGVGGAASRILAADGHHVVLADIDPTDAAQVAAEITAGGAPTPAVLTVDMADGASILMLVEAVLERFGRIDSIVNNAATSAALPLHASTDDEWGHVLDVDLRGPMQLCRAVLPSWQRQGTGGAVVNVASRSWAAGAPPSYAAAKAGLVGLTRSLAVELAPLSVRANAVAPSFMITKMTSEGVDEHELAERAAAFRSVTPLPRLVEPVDVANTIAFLCSERARGITGEVIHVCNGSQLPTAPAHAR